jgi:hypothetical protein
MRKKTNNINSYNLPHQTTKEIMGFVSKRVDKNNKVEVPVLPSVKVVNLTKLFRQLSLMEPDTEQAFLMDRAMDEIQSLEKRSQILTDENTMLHEQLNERDRYGV